MFNRSAMAVCVALFLHVSTAHAQTNPEIAVSLPSNGSYFSVSAGGNRNASQFLVGANSINVSTVTAYFRSGDAINTPNVQFYLDYPGIPFGTLGSKVSGDVSATTSMDTPNLITFNFNGSVTLAANTKYWLSFGNSSNSEVVFTQLFNNQSTEGSNGIAYALRAISISGNTHQITNPSNSSAVYTINGVQTPSGGVPEPGAAAAALAFVGMMGSLILHKRRSAKRFAASSVDF